MKHMKTHTIIMDLTDYLETSHRIHSTVGTQNKALLQAVLSLDLQWKVGNTGPAPVTLTRQYNQSEESDGEQLYYLFVKRKTPSFSFPDYLQLHYVHATVSVKNQKASIDELMII